MRDIIVRIVATAACIDPKVSQRMHPHCDDTKGKASGALGDSRMMYDGGQRRLACAVAAPGWPVGVTTAVTATGQSRHQSIGTDVVRGIGWKLNCQILDESGFRHESAPECQ